LFYAGALVALVHVTGCDRPPVPAAPPSGKGWRILAEGSQEATARMIQTGRKSHMLVVTGARLNEGAKEQSMTEDDARRQLTVGRNVSELPFRAPAASVKP